MPYISEIKSFITVTSSFQEITLVMEIESGKRAQTTISLDNHLTGFVELINNDIEPLLVGYNVCNQAVIDKVINNLATELKRKIPNDLLLALSFTIAKLASAYYDLPLYQYLGGIKKVTMPIVFRKGEYPLKGYSLDNLSEPIHSLIKTEKIEKVKDALKHATFLDLYSITQTTLNNLHKNYPHLNFITNKNLNNAYVVFELLSEATLTELLKHRPSFIATKMSDVGVADIVLALGAEYAILNDNQLNRLIMLNEEMK